MALSIRPIDPVNRPDFAGEVSGIDLRATMTPQQVAAIVEGMDKFAVLVFRDQRIDDTQQLAFSRNFGTLEIANSDVRRDEDRRLAPEIADISNLGKNNDIMSREDRRRLFSLGNMLWHSDSSFKPTPAKYSLLHARVLPSKDGNTEFADMRAAYDALDEDTKAEINDLVCEHSQQYSRGVLGFDFTEEERCATRQCRSAWCAGIRDRAALDLSVGPCRRDPRHADAGGARPAARPHRARDPAQIRLRTPLADRRFGDVGQPGDDAPRPALRPRPGARTPPHHGRGRPPDRGAGGLKNNASTQRALSGRRGRGGWSKTRSVPRSSARQ